MSTGLFGMPANRPPTSLAFSHISIQDRGRPDFRKNDAIKLDVIPAPTMRHCGRGVIVDDRSIEFEIPKRTDSCPSLEVLKVTISYCFYQGPLINQRTTMSTNRTRKRSLTSWIMMMLQVIFMTKKVPAQAPLEGLFYLVNIKVTHGLDLKGVQRSNLRICGLAHNATAVQTISCPNSGHFYPWFLQQGERVDPSGVEYVLTPARAIRHSAKDVTSFYHRAEANTKKWNYRPMAAKYGGFCQGPDIILNGLSYPQIFSKSLPVRRYYTLLPFAEQNANNMLDQYYFLIKHARAMMKYWEGETLPQEEKEDYYEHDARVFQMLFRKTD